MKKIGIYSIENKNNKKKYIGLSTNMGARLVRHKRNLLGGRHRNKHLQSAFSKYGEEVFRFYILEECSEEELSEKEKYWIEKEDTCNSSFGYNKTWGGEFGRLHPDIYKRYSERLKGGTISEEQKEQIRKTLTGRKRPKEEIEKAARSCRKLDDRTENVIIDLYKHGFGYVIIANMCDFKKSTVQSVIYRHRKGTKNERN